MMAARTVLAILSASLLFACSSPDRHLAPIAAAPAGPYRLGAGDEVRIAIFGLDTVTNTYTVGDGGTISMPLLNTVPASGRTVEELQVAIVDVLRQKEIVRAPSVSVQVQKYRPFFILGEVQRPGQYPYVPGMTVLTAVSIAGGFTFRAETRRAALVRPTATSAIKGAALPETQVLPGDTINIYEAWF